MDETRYDTSTPAGLKAARLALGLTQDALGAALGVHWGTISRWEHGEVPTVVALAVECLIRRQRIAPPDHT